MPLSGHLPCVEREPAQGATADAPVLVLMHGFASYEQHLFEHAGLFDPRLHILAPRAPLRIGPGAHRWFHFERTPDGPAIRDDEEAQSLATLLRFLEDVIAQRAPRRLYLLGHSQGGTMALTVAVTRPDLIDGVANINGRLLSKSWERAAPAAKLAGMPAFMRYGTDNPIVPMPLAHTTRDRLKAFGMGLDYADYPNIGHGFTPEILQESARWLSARLDSE